MKFRGNLDEIRCFRYTHTLALLSQRKSKGRLPASGREKLDVLDKYF
jgi:hypothetical protein